MRRFIHGATAAIRPRALWLLSLVALLTVVAACGGNGSSTGSDQTSATPTGSVVSTAKTDLGTILVDSAGKTVYMFEADSPGMSACAGPCLSSWPIVTAPASLPSTVAGVKAKLGVLERPDGTKQLTIGGRPAYTYAGDTKPGTTTGQGNNGFGALWWVLAPDGTPVTTAPTSPGTGGYGGGAY